MCCGKDTLALNFECELLGVIDDDTRVSAASAEWSGSSTQSAIRIGQSRAGIKGKGCCSQHSQYKRTSQNNCMIAGSLTHIASAPCIHNLEMNQHQSSCSDVERETST